MRFDFSAPLKKNKTHTQKVKVNLYKTVRKNIYCVAIIDINGNYFARDIISGENYIITSRSYNIKTTICYSQQLVENKRIKGIKLKGIESFKTPWLYLPFAPGVGLLGNIVKTNYDSRLLFDLNQVFDMPKDNDFAREAFLYYRDNYETIYNCILTKYGVRESLRDDC